MSYDLTRFNEFVAQNRIIRDLWTGTDEQGRETACLLAAIAPGIDAPEKCPAAAMPQWLAHLVPAFDDCGSFDAWPGMVQRFARVLNRMNRLNLDDAALERAKWRTIDAALIIAEPLDAAGVVAPVRALIARYLSGDPPAGIEWAEAARAAAAAEATWAAWAAARAAATRAARAAAAEGAAEGAAWAAAEGAAEGAASAATWAARAAARAAATRAARAAAAEGAAEGAAWAAAEGAAEGAAAEGAAEGAAAEGAAEGAAWVSAWDAITNSCLTALEDECARGEI